MKTLAAVSLCLAFACSTPRQATEPAAPSADAGYQQVLQSTDLDGKPVGAPAANVRATLVVFFASWCSHCRRELATIDELRREHPDLRIVGLNAYEEWSDMSDQQR
ncbi:MAG: TlpA family protein disulfide reductase, partial [Deltaproteobacteria bacterium]|nr:TlpA family protein disulfide reductase [Deltaproteobacteria bacterium]